LESLIKTDVIVLDINEILRGEQAKIINKYAIKWVLSWSYMSEASFFYLTFSSSWKRLFALLIFT